MSALVVGRAKAQIALVESMDAIGLSGRELAFRLDVSESIPRRWAQGEKPAPLALLFAAGVPDALALGVIERAHGTRGKSSPEAALRSAVSRVDRDGGVSRAALLDMMAKLGELAGKATR